MEILSWENLKGRFRWPLVFGLTGLVLFGLGLFVVFLSSQEEQKIEIISSQEEKEEETILVDIEGAVQHPGVYTLSFGSRVEDLLVVSGGFSAEADREWIEKTLNRAQKVSDGAKIYIPKKGDPTSLASAAASAGSVRGTESTVNINTASQKELEALWGIGPVTAQKIIENRPYQSVDELLSKKILKSNVYERIAGSLSVY